MVIRLDKIEIVDKFVGKILGLMGRKDFRGYNGMLLTNANSIHTFFVKFPIDVLFLDKNYKVVKTVENLRPFWFSPIVFRAKHTLEIPKGSIKKQSLEEGDEIKIS